MSPGLFGRALGGRRLLDRLRHSSAAAWALALVGSAILLWAGWSLGREDWRGRVDRAIGRVAAEASRANRLEAEHRRLEQRLAKARSRLEACLAGDEGAGPGPAPPAERPEPLGRLLHEGQAAVLLDGRLVITLEAVTADPRRARVRVRVVGGKEGLALLAPGEEVDFVVDGRRLRLVVKRLHSSSAAVLLLPG
jgi:hypothetical protein